MRLMKSVVSFMNEGSSLMIGWSQVSTNWDTFSVTLLTLDTIGLMPIGFLWIFLRKYRMDVLCCLGGMQNSFISLSIKPEIKRLWSFPWILVLIEGVMSVVRGLYTVVSDKCFRPSSIYWVLSRTTIVEPF